MFEIKQATGGSSPAPPPKREATPPPARYDAAFEPSSRPPAAPLKIVSVPRINAFPPKLPSPHRPPLPTLPVERKGAPQGLRCCDRAARKSAPPVAACGPRKYWPAPEEEEEDPVVPPPIASPDPSPSESSEEEGEDPGHDVPQMAPGWGPVRLSNAASGDLLFENFEDCLQL